MSPDTQPLLLVQDVPTRWNSTFMMLERFVKLRDVLIPLMGRPEWSSKLKTKFRHEDWALMGKITTVLQVQYSTVQCSAVQCCT